MAFLDNSGDIILDAVLTDVGRKRMAEGNFNIVKFALGDDEIDYSLYNPNHPSGSAYYDLEILQTPIFEAFTSQNASINYGLLSNTNTELLYLPVALMNEKNALATTYGVNNTIKYNGIIYVRDNSGDSVASIATRLDGTVTNSLDGNTTTPNNFALFEIGLNTSDVVGTAANRDAFLTTTGLVDDSLIISYDSRIIQSVYGLDSGGEFFNDSSGNLTVNLSLIAGTSGGGAAIGLENYDNYTVNTVANQIHYFNTSADGTDFSVIAGPRAVIGGLAFGIVGALNDVYTNYGNTGQAIGGLTGTYDYIDTTVYVVGASTGTTIQIPLRIIRTAS